VVPAKYATTWEVELLEEWKPVPGFEEWYEVSSLGQVRSWKNGRRGRRSEPRLLKLIPDGKGYLFFNATLPPDVRRMVMVHRAVCEAWHGPTAEGQALVRHLDGKHLNNRPGNLAWGTAKENMEDALRHGSRVLGHKLCAEQVIDIRRKVGMGHMSQRQAATAHGVHVATIRQIVRGETYAHVVP